jgi:hypothetical protein
MKSLRQALKAESLVEIVKAEEGGTLEIELNVKLQRRNLELAKPRIAEEKGFVKSILIEV